MKKKFIVAVTGTVLLFGCNSFNRFETPNTPSSTSRSGGTGARPTPTPDGYEDEQPEEKSVALCPMYKPPVLPKVPALPYKDLEKAKGDQEQIDIVMQKHIAELRAHSNRVTWLVARAAQRYQTQCNEHLRKEKE